ncbi:hypothetical protein DFJ73DRAFT_561736 [Zopfochytrium polystomum]|nr:hypothetical protein DFJ73DRAFT_561736 [Zopfochytrium polystomum]
MSFRTGRSVVFVTGGGWSWISRAVGKGLVFVLAATVPAILIYAEHSFRETLLAMREAKKTVVSVPSDSVHPEILSSLVGSLVHIASTDVQPQLITDHDFGVEFPGAVKVARSTEYCQWQEHFTDDTTTSTDSNGEENESTVRRYYYTKGWSSVRIPSVFFDQPVAHHNPQHDPFPSTSCVTDFAKFGASFRVLSEVLANASPLRTKMSYSKAQLQDFATSPAATYGGERGWTGSGGSAFRFIGSGYFLSRYESSAAEELFKLAGRVVEGSLDVQIGDFLSFCTAGDIRVSFQAVTVPPARGATVIGKLMNEKGDIGLFSTSRNYKIGLFSLDASTPVAEILRREIRNSGWYLFGARAAVFLWAIILSFAYTSRFDRSCFQDPGRLQQDRVRFVLRALGGFATTVGVSSVVVRGTVSAGFGGLGALTAGILGMALADPRGWDATLRMLGFGGLFTAASAAASSIKKTK